MVPIVGISTVSCFCLHLNVPRMLQVYTDGENKQWKDQLWYNYSHRFNTGIVRFFVIEFYMCWPKTRLLKNVVLCECKHSHSPTAEGIIARQACLTKAPNILTLDRRNRIRISKGFVVCCSRSQSHHQSVCQTLLAEIKKSCLVDTVLFSSKQHLQAAAPSVALASWGPGQVRRRIPRTCWCHPVGESSFFTSCGAKAACLSADQSEFSTGSLYKQEGSSVRLYHAQAWQDYAWYKIQVCVRVFGTYYTYWWAAERYYYAVRVLLKRSMQVLGNNLYSCENFPINQLLPNIFKEYRVYDYLQLVCGAYTYLGINGNRLRRVVHTSFYPASSSWGDPRILGKMWFLIPPACSGLPWRSPPGWMCLETL